MAKEIWKGEDKIYGEQRIEDPVITALVSSEPMQRLKKLNQFGLPDELYHLKGFSRYEHSIGVMYLLQHLGASDEEQVAGLLHDVSHTAFSHVYDWVVGTAGKEDSQDDGHEQFIRGSEIKSILEEHGYSVDRITDYHHFGLLERESPDLCADRVDYVLREIDPGLAKEIFIGLRVFNGQIVCAEEATASKLGKAFLNKQINHWGGYEGMSRYSLFSTALKRALELGIIQKQDFLDDDDYIVAKLEASKDKLVQDTLAYLRQNPLPRVTEGQTVTKKFRFIDPSFISEGKLVRLTEVDEEYRQSLENARLANKKGVVVPNLISTNPLGVTPKIAKC